MLRRILFTTAMAFTVLANIAIAGPSAKFAATYNDDRFNVISIADVNDCTEDCADFDSNTGFTLATIKVPQDKELMVGVSAEIGLVTDTSIKGKEGGAARAIAGAGASVLVFAVPVEGANGTAALAAPGPVILAARVQVLDATLGGVLEECTDVNADGTVTIPDECEFSDEEIGLILATLASHHFNFVLPDMDQGEYNLVAVFTTGAIAAVDIDEASVSDGGTVSGSAYAAAMIGKSMVTVQQVRATKGGIIDADIIEP